MAFLIPETLDTPRLHLRMFGESDWQALCEMFCDPECVTFIAKAPLSNWETWRKLAAYLGHWQLRGYGPYAVVEKASGCVMGPVGLWYPIEFPEPEIKWALARKFWGKGYAAEAAMAVKDMAAKELKWKRLMSLIHVDNVRSKSVARRIGGSFDSTIYLHDQHKEIYAYSL